MSRESFLLLGSPILLFQEGDVMQVDQMMPGASLFCALGLGLAVVDAVAYVSAAATGFLSIKAAPGILSWLLAILGVMLFVRFVTQHATGWSCGLVFFVAFGSLFLFLLALAFSCGNGGVRLFLLGLVLLLGLLVVVRVEGLPHVKV